MDKIIMILLSLIVIGLIGLGILAVFAFLQRPKTTHRRKSSEREELNPNRSDRGLTKRTEVERQGTVNKEQGFVEQYQTGIRDFHRANLSGVQASQADLREVNLREANLSNADLTITNLSNADLRKADLRHADLSCADLTYANLREADLSHANLGMAKLNHADLSGAKLVGTCLALATLPESWNTQKKTIILTGAVMPDGTEYR